MNETIKNLVERKSCKAYTGEHIDRALIEDIISAGLNAPTGKNMQTPIFVVITKDELVTKLSRMNAEILGADVDPFYGAKDLVIVLARKECTYIYDGSLAMGNLLNAAWSLGVDACWVHRAREVFESEEGKKLLREWGIDFDVEGIGFCLLGKAAKEKPKTAIRDGRVFYI